MYPDKVQEGDEEFVLNNLCNEAKKELTILFGDNFKFEILSRLKDVVHKFSIKLKKNDELVAIFGIFEVEKDIGGIYFLSTDNLKEGNIITLLRGSRKQVQSWMRDFSLILDTCFVENSSVRKWLILLGFIKVASGGDGVFEIFGKGDLLLIDRIFKND